MRIGFDAKRYFHNKTGLGNYSRSLVHTLAENFPEDEFWLFDKTGGKLSEEFNNLKIWKPAMRKAMWRLTGQAKDAFENKIQLYHGLSNEIPLGLRRHKIASVVTIHDVIFRRFPDYYPLTDRMIYHQKTKYAVKNADMVIATSRNTADDLVELYKVNPDRIRVVYQPVQKHWYHRPETGRPIVSDYLLYISSFTGRKNHSTLIEAFSMISKQTDAMLVLAGSSGETLTDCKKFIAHEKLESRILIYENCSPEVLNTLMHHAAGFVYPSYYEGFGIPLAEAAVKGLPMAVSDIPVFRELAADAATYFNPNRATEIADNMLALLRKEYIATMESGRIQLLKKIDPVRISSEMMQLYRSLIS